jgi:hypothetical protein
MAPPYKIRISLFNLYSILRKYLFLACYEETN